MRLASRLTIRIHSARDAEGRHIQATVHRAYGGEFYDVDVIFDRQARDPTVLNLIIADAVPRLWTLAPEPRAILENQDVIELDGERWKAHARFVREDGLVEHELYEASAREGSMPLILRTTTALGRDRTPQKSGRSSLRSYTILRTVLILCDL